jgi:phosphate transport system protein
MTTSDRTAASPAPIHHEPPVNGAFELRHGFRAWLDRIDGELLAAAQLVVEALPRIAGDFLAGDRRCLVDGRVLSGEVEARCRRVEEQGFLLLAREAPVAGDLRRLVAIMRLVTAVERSAALLRHVAETLDGFDPRRLPVHLRADLEELGARTAAVYQRGVTAWREQDALAVSEVDRLDEGVDSLRTSVLERAELEVHEPAELVLLGLLARYFERIADHGVSFAQHTTFAVTGQRVDVGP